MALVAKTAPMERHGARLIGANAEAINAEKTVRFSRISCWKSGWISAHSGVSPAFQEAKEVATEIGAFP